MKISLKMKVIIGIIIIIVILVGVYLSGFVRSNFENKKLREELVENAQTTDINLDISKYPDLPEPVKRYFIYTFNGKKSIKIKNVFWKEKGKFKNRIGFTITCLIFSLIINEKIWRSSQGEGSSLENKTSKDNNIIIDKTSIENGIK